MGWFARLFGFTRGFDVEPFRKLTCSSCGRAFELGEDASLITDEQVADALQEAGVAATRAGAPTGPDLVQNVALDERRRGRTEDALLIIAGTLSRRERRLWQCGACEALNAYPGHESHLEGEPLPDSGVTLVAGDIADPDQQFELGVRYMAGIGVPEDPALANEWFRKAAEQGHAHGQFHLATNYHGGVGVAQDKSAAFEWYLKAAKQGIARAQCTVAIFINDGEVVTKDKARVIYWLQKAADQNDGSALFNLGVMHYNGDGVPQSDQEARRLFRRSAKTGYAKAAEVLRQLR